MKRSSVNMARKKYTSMKLQQSILLFILLSLATSVYGTEGDPFKEVEENFKHSETYYWYGRSRSNSLYEFQLSRKYLEIASEMLDHIPLTDSLLNLKADLLKREFFELEETLDAMEVICIENLNGRFPLFMELSGRAPEYEYWDDSNELALENAIDNLLEIHYPTVPLGEQMRFSIVLSYPDDGLLEEVAMQYMSANSDHLTIGKFSLLEYITESELMELDEKNFNTEILEKICKGVGIQDLGIVWIEKVDEIDDLYYWTAGFRAFSTNGDISPYVREDGFSFDKNPVKSTAIGASLVSVFLMCIGLVLILQLALVIKGDQVSLKERISSLGGAALFYFISLVAGMVFLNVLLHLVRPLIPNSDEFFQTLSSRLIWRFLVPLILSIVPILLNYILAAKFSNKRLHREGNLFGLICGSSSAYIITLVFLSVIKFGIQFEFRYIFLAIFVILAYSYALTFLYRDYIVKRNMVSLWSLILILPTMFLVAYHLLLNIEGTDVNGIRMLWIVVPLITGMAVRGESGLSRRLFKKESTPERKSVSDVIASPEDLKMVFENPKYYVPITIEESGDLNFPAVTSLLFKPSDYTSIQLLHGPRGVGKTRMIKELQNYLEGENDFMVFYGDCDEFQDSNAIPYEPFVEALGEYMGKGAFSNQSKRVTDFVNTLKELEVGPVSALAGLIGSSENQNDGADANDVAIDILKIFKKLLGSKKKVLLVIEDIQWIDNTTVRLLLALISSMCISREELEDFRILLTLRVEAQDQVESNDLLRKLKKIDSNLLEIVDLSDNADIGFKYDDYFFKLLESNQVQMNYHSVNRLNNYFKSNDFRIPLHFNQIMINIIDKGWIVKDNDEFKLISRAKLDELLPPNDLSKIYREKFLLLDPALLKILISASYIGMSFEARILASVWWGIKNAENKLLELFHSLQEAERLGLVIDKSDEDDVYEFTSRGLMAELRAYGNLSSEEKIQKKSGNNDEIILPQAVREYHKRIIAAIETYKGDELKLDINVLCSVANRCRFLDVHNDQNLKRIIKYNCYAGDRCYNAGRKTEAIDYYRYAYTILKREEANLNLKNENCSTEQLLLKLLQAYLDINHPVEAMNWLDDERFRDTEYYPEYLNLKALIFFRNRSYLKVINLMEEFEKIPPDRVSIYQSLRARFNRILAENKDTLKNLETLLSDVKEIPEQVKEILDLQGEIMNNIARSYINQGSSKSLDYLDSRLVLLLERKGDVIPFTDAQRRDIYEDEIYFPDLTAYQKESLKYNTGAYAWYFQKIKDHSTARFFIEESIKINKALGDQFGIALHTKSLADCRKEQKDYSEDVFKYYTEAYRTGKFRNLNDKFFLEVFEGLRLVDDEGELGKENQLLKLEADLKNTVLQKANFSDDRQLHVLRHFKEIDPGYMHSLIQSFASKKDQSTSDVTEQSIIKEMALVGSKFNPDFCISPDDLWRKISGKEFLEQLTCIKRSEHSREYTLNFTEQQFKAGIGWDSLLPCEKLNAQEKEEIVLETRGSDKVRVLHADKKIPTRQVNIIIGKSEEGSKVITIFPGSLAPPLPNKNRQDKDQYRDSLLFWEKHVLVEP